MAGADRQFQKESAFWTSLTTFRTTCPRNRSVTPRRRIEFAPIRLPYLCSTIRLVTRPATTCSQSRLYSIQSPPKSIRGFRVKPCEQGHYLLEFSSTSGDNVLARCLFTKLQKNGTNLSSFLYLLKKSGTQACILLWWLLRLTKGSPLTCNASNGELRMTCKAFCAIRSVCNPRRVGSVLYPRVSTCPIPLARFKRIIWRQ